MSEATGNKTDLEFIAERLDAIIEDQESIDQLVGSEKEHFDAAMKKLAGHIESIRSFRNELVITAGKSFATDGITINLDQHRDAAYIEIAVLDAILIEHRTKHSQRDH